MRACFQHIVSRLQAAAAGLTGRAARHDVGLTTCDDIEGGFGVSHLGDIAECPKFGAALDKDEAFSTSIHKLRAAIRRLSSEPCQIVAVTSALPAEGKTTTVIALARSTTSIGLRTLLIDCDIRRASVSERIGRGAVVGLLEVLQNDVQVEDAIVYDRDTELSILPLKAACGTLKNIFASPEMKALMTRLRWRYDVIFLDCAPVLIIADTRDAVRLAQTVVLLTRWDTTPKSGVYGAVRTLRDAGVAISGLALTRVPCVTVEKAPYPVRASVTKDSEQGTRTGALSGGSNRSTPKPFFDRRRSNLNVCPVLMACS